ncbi:amino acid adenylation domain-containing protein [Kordia sp.]|uniref:non-ribosomal peptide synthetase n=1 Tax=Kordia sp. TaxID=1965332 RepID=UPI003D2ABF90
MDSNTVEKIQGYEFSENQKNVWQLGNDSQQVCYNQLVIKFEAAIATETLKKAISAVIQKHQVLSFHMLDDKKFSFPLQVIAENQDIDYHEISLEEDRIIETTTAKINGNYDATINKPIRFCGATTAEGVQYLTIRLFALWGDSYSIVYFKEELTKALHNLDAYVAEEIEKVDYLNFCAWQNELLAEAEEDAINFWKSHEYRANQNIIPFATATNANFSPVKKKVATISGATYEKLKAFSEANEIEMGTILLAQFSNYLASFTTDQLTIGYIPFERNYEELKDTLGLVAKQLPFTYTKSEATMLETVKNAKQQLTELADWADYFSLDRENKGVAETTFNYSYEFIHYKKEATATIIDSYGIQDQFELKLSCVQLENSIEVAIYFDQEKYNTLNSSILETQLHEFFNTITVETKKQLAITDAEQQIITTTNATESELLKITSVVSLFELQVTQNPTATAIVFEDKKITYQELNTKANQFANYLTSTHNVGKGDAICVLLERSDLFIISILGILKTGAYYVPIDTNYPDERVQFILEDTKTKLLVCDATASERKLKEIPFVHPTTAEIYEGIQTYEANYNLEDVAYCIYTSGSTGNPKGCLITNKNLVNYITWANEYYFKNEDSGNWGLITSVSFDLTITALFTSITRGKQLWIGGNQKDIYELLTESFNHPEIDTLKLTPTHLSVLKELEISETQITTIICGGEALTAQQIENVHALNAETTIYNEYGPTEATVGCVVKKIEKEDAKIVIGKPIANTKIHILDEQHQTCPIGVVGELGIAGAGVAKGYLNRPELNETKFVAHETEERIYKTGDLARWLPDGNIEYLGRIDSQVKIRGYRIELGEIEKVLTENSNIEEAVVLVTLSDQDEKELTAFILTSQQVDGIEVRRTIANKIPEYMMPSSMIQVDKMPMTINGKIDTQYLIDLKAKETQNKVAYVAPSNEVEEKLVAIWEEILNKEKIGVNDDFFSLGGNSLLVMKLMNKISHEFGVKIDFKSFFSKPTISSSGLEITFMIDQKSMNEDNLIELDI